MKEPDFLPKTLYDLFIGAPVSIEEALRLTGKEKGPNVLPLVIGSPEKEIVELPVQIPDLYVRIKDPIKYGSDTPNIWAYDNTSNAVVEQVIDAYGNIKPYQGYHTVQPLQEDLIKRCISNIQRMRTQPQYDEEEKGISSAM